MDSASIHLVLFSGPECMREQLRKISHFPPLTGQCRNSYAHLRNLDVAPFDAVRLSSQPRSYPFHYPVGQTQESSEWWMWNSQHVHMCPFVQHGKESMRIYGEIRWGESRWARSARSSHFRIEARKPTAFAIFVLTSIFRITWPYVCLFAF